MKFIVQYKRHKTAYDNLTDAMSEFGDLLAMESDSTVPVDDGEIAVVAKCDGEEDVFLIWNINVWKTICHEEGCDCDADVHPADDDYDEGQDEILVVEAQESEKFDAYKQEDERREDIEQIVDKLKTASDDVFAKAKKLLGLG